MNIPADTNFRPISAEMAIRNNIVAWLKARAQEDPDKTYTLQEIRTAPENRAFLGPIEESRIGRAALDLAKSKQVVRVHTDRPEFTGASYKGTRPFEYRAPKPGEEIEVLVREMKPRVPPTPTKPPARKNVMAKSPAPSPEAQRMLERFQSGVNIDAAHGVADSDVKHYTLPEITIDVAKNGRGVSLEIGGLRINIGVKE